MLRSSRRLHDEHAPVKEKDELIFKHIEQRQQLALRQRSELSRRDLEIEQLKQDIHQYRTMKSGEPSKLKEEFRKASCIFL